MDFETVRKEFPKILEALDEEIDDLRFLLDVDINYDDLDDDEYDVFDPEDYNYLIYLNERLQKAMGEDLLARFPEILEATGAFENFYASEEDLYGVKTDRDESEIARIILSEIESRLG